MIKRGHDVLANMSETESVDKKSYMSKKYQKSNFGIDQFKFCDSKIV